MQHMNRWMIVGLIISSLYLAACGQTPEAATEETPQITVEQLGGNEPTREIVTEDAAKRLDIQTAEVRDMLVNGTQQKVIPYAAIIYDTQGTTWVYLNKDGPLTFVRYPIAVRDIQGDQAFLSDGPPSGSTVVTVGATELYGAETEFEEE